MDGSERLCSRLGIETRDGERIQVALSKQDWGQASRLLRTALLHHAVVGADPQRDARVRELRSRLLLLRWSIRAGLWEECVHDSVRAYELLLVLDLGGDALLAWLGTVHAVAQLERGWGRRFRGSIANVLWHCRARDAGTAGSYVRRLATAFRAVARDHEAAPFPAGLCPRAAGDDRCSVPFAGRGWPRLLATSSIGSVLGPARAELADGTGGLSKEFGLEFVRRWLARMAAGAFDLEGRGRRGSEASLLGLCAAVLRCRYELTREERSRVEMALEGLGTRSTSAWVRAACLESAAEVLLCDVDELRTHGASTLRRARADLALAAGIYFRLGLVSRAKSAEERSLLLGWGGDVVGRASAEVARDADSPGCGGPDPALLRADRRGRPTRSSGDNQASPRVRCSSLQDVRRQAASLGFVTSDPRTLEEIARLLLLAPSPLPILVHGESGTGKEVLARAVHEWSGLPGDFVAIHCGAIPKDLLESELFGHTRGAFTGAAGEKPGLVELAHHGTLFLDEIGEMSHDAQMKMLRVLESGEVRRVGDVRTRKVNVRIVAATHRNLEDAVQEGSFRLDLLHRIRSVVVEIPSLSQRPGDIPLLVREILADVDRRLRLDDDALGLLLGHSWPGNVRELRGALLRAAYLGRAVGRTVLPPEFLGIRSNASIVPISMLFAASRGADRVTVTGPVPGTAGPCLKAADPATPETLSGNDGVDIPALEDAGLEGVLDALERGLIVRALDESGWNKTHAAKSLGGLSRTTLISKMKRLGIEGDRESVRAQLPEAANDA